MDTKRLEELLYGCMAQMAIDEERALRDFNLIGVVESEIREMGFGYLLEEKNDNTYKVVLSACGNIDHNENPNDSIVNGIKINGLVMQASSIRECRQIVHEYIEDNCLGARNWDGGNVFKNNEQVGYISYNGRYWSKEGEKYRDF